MHAQAPLHPATSFSLADSAWRSPVGCLSSSHTFEDLVSCFNDFTVPHAYYNASTYAQAQPQPSERSAWIDAVAALLKVDGQSFTCGDALLSLQPPNPLAELYTVSWFQDHDTSSAFCILHETSSFLFNDTAVYAKGWGLLAVPAIRAAGQRDLHLAAPHPEYDLGTPQQAAALFKSVHLRSLLVAGRIRTSYMVPTDCIASPGGKNWKTDPAHDIEQPFFNATVAIYRSQMKRAGCNPQTCAFIQLHGKGTSTCGADHVFLSTGLGASAASVAWYKDAAARPVKTLQKALLSPPAFPQWTIALPSDDPICTALMATTNVFGRHLNGVGLDDVCHIGATAKTATGLFVHIEQNAASRAPDVYSNWTRAFEDAFPVPE